MIASDFLRNFNTDMTQLNNLEEKISSGRNINRPSDDPVGAVTALRFRSTITETDKYTANVDSANAWLETTDMALGQAGDVLKRVRELVLQGANDTLPADSRTAIAKEINQLRDQMINIANTTHDGRYIFAGFQTNNSAFTTGGVYNGDSGVINYEIGVNTKIPVNINGNAAFKGAVDIFNLLTTIQNDLNAGSTPNLSNIDLHDIDSATSNLLNFRADVGARQNRLELTKSRLQDISANFTNLLSKTEGIDQAKVITELNAQQNTYQTALAAGAKIIQPSLMDYLK